MQNYVHSSLTYNAYKKLIDDLLSKGMTTGPEQTEPRVSFSKLNRHRMERLEKTVTIDPEVLASLNANHRSMIFLVITEGWCGDAAQNIPVIEKVAAESDMIETRYILRDDHPSLMDAFLTNGSRSIPKLIALDRSTLEVLGTWGPRPAAAAELFAKRKEQGVEKAVIQEELQRWYNWDRGRSLQLELASLIKNWGGKQLAAGKGI
jgi:hypothetical protein